LGASQALAAPEPGDSLAPFTVRTAQGAPYHWQPGKVAVVSFCAFWCNTWKQQLPRLAEARNTLKGLPVEFLQISVDGRWMEKAAKAPDRVLADPGAKWSSSIGIDRVPYTFVVDATGRIRWAGFGIVRSADVVRETRSALEPLKGGVVYLTFDDFPSRAGDQELLDVLRAQGVHATFFCICQKLADHAAVVRRAVREGQSLQMHSWAHDGDRPELDRCRAALKALTGVEPKLYRPPGSERVFGPNGKPLKHPAADPYDYASPAPAELVRRVALLVKPGAVIQLHAGMPNTLKALPDIVANLRKRGFVFEVLR
jgi:peptidoglycan/xylan/chitin deacetylase (PgdA/CDA1 family)